MKNDFLPFANQSSANVISQTDYASLPERLSGFKAGVAKASQLNKVWRQSSTIAASVGQFIEATSSVDVIDDGDDKKLALMIAKAVKDITTGRIFSGSVIMWRGTQVPEGWLLCDGKNNTPNLSASFVLGVGSNPVGNKGGSLKITVDNMPAHTHTGTSTGAGAHGHGVNQGNHSHTLNYNGAQGRDYRNRASDPRWDWGDNNWGNNPNNAHTNNRGTGISLQGVGDHSHSMSLNNTGGGQDYIQPYFTLAYIMKA